MPALTNDCAWLGVCRVAELSRNPALHRLNGLSASALASIEAEALELLQLFAAEEIEPRAMRLAVQSYLPAARRDAPEAATMPDPEPMRDLQLRLTDARARARAHREATVTLPLLANSLLSDPTPAMARELLRAVPEPHEASVRTSRSDSGAERALESLGRNLVEAARGGHMGPLATRPALIDALIQALQPDGPRCALLIGEQGVGRTGLVHGLAARIATGRVPAHLQKAHLLEVPGTALRPVGAGADSRVRVLEKLMLDAQRRDETDRGTILFVDDIDGLTRSSASSPARLRLADVIRSALSGPPVMWIAAVDSMVLDDEPDLLRELDGLCTMLHVEEPSPAEAERMVSEACEALEARHRLTITPAAISAAVALSARFIGDRRLPDKAIDLLDDICGACGLDSIVMPGERTTVSRSALRIERPHVVTAVADRIGVPRDLVAADDAARCRFLQADLSQRLIEQAPSIAVLSSLLERALPEQPDHRPLAAMLLASDDADAVQAVATSLARVTFGDGTRAVRIVPEQFREHGLTTQLLGTRSGPPGELTLTLRRTPGMVVLIDGTEQ
ncbi:MAG: AAA family ATPase, partial [Planctomycetota bacterium]